MGTVFISYRRGDSEGQARALSLELEHLIGKDSVFMDVDGIALGHDFRKVLLERLQTCDIVLALIGPNWLEAKDVGGNRRIESPTDFVRVEIASALKRNIAVTPVLVQGATIPSPEQLPEDLKDLAFRNGFELSHIRWESDVRELVRRLGLLNPNHPSPALSEARPGITRLSSLESRIKPISPSVPTPWSQSRKLLVPFLISCAVVAIGVALVWTRLSRGKSPDQTAKTAVSVTNSSGGTPQLTSAQREKPAEDNLRAKAERSAAVPRPAAPSAIAPTPTTPTVHIPPGPQPFAGSYHLTSMLAEHDKKCLESDDGSHSAHMDPCGYFSGQIWTIEPARIGYYRLKSQFQEINNKCLDSGDLLGITEMKSCDDSPNQLWKITKSTSAGYYRLQSMGTESQKGCLASSNGGGHPPKMVPCANYSNELWKILDNSSGTGTQISKAGAFSASPVSTAAAGQTTTGSVIPSCMGGTWNDKWWDPHDHSPPNKWSFVVLDQDTIRAQRIDGAASGTFTRSGNSFTGTVIFFDGKQFPTVLTPNQDCTNVTTNQGWSYYR